MRADLYKLGQWVKLPVVDGTSVGIECEFPAPFVFVASRARVNVFDDDGLFRSGGIYEILRGDKIRIYAADVMGEGGMLVFEGGVDLGIEWDKAAGVLSLSALGYMAELKDIKAGKLAVVGGAVDEDGELARYRYVKTVEEAEVDAQGNESTGSFEYIATQAAWDRWADSPSKRLGYKLQYLFDTRGIPFAGEEAQSTSLFGPIADEDGVWRRRLDQDEAGGALTPVDLSAVAENLLEQVRQIDGEYSMDFDPGEIRGEATVQMRDTKYMSVDMFLNAHDDQNWLYFGAWIGDVVPETKRARAVSYASSVEFFGVVNQSVLDLKGSADFSGGAEYAMRLGYLGHGLAAGELEDNFNFYRRATFQGVLGSRVFCQLWSWRRYEAPVGGNKGYWIRGAYAQIVSLDRDSGQQAGSWYPEESLKTVEFDELAIPEGPNMYKSVVWDAVTDTYVFSESDMSPEVSDVVFQDARYYVIDGVLFVSGDLALSKIAFDLRDKAVSTLFLELAKVTNSVFFVTSGKVITLKARDLIGNNHEVDAVLLAVDGPGVDDYKGARVPQLNSEIVESEGYSSALRAFYEDGYYPRREIRYTLTLLESLIAANIGLLDGVLFDGVGPIQVRRIDFEQGRVTVEGAIR